MANREQEMNEIHKGIWQIANDLRGAVDGWDFKSYVLGTLFYKYISENLRNFLNENEFDSGNKDFDYAKFDDDEIDEITKNDIINSKGFFIYPSQLFCNIVETCESDENLNINIANIFKAIEDSTKGTKSEKAFKGLFDDYDTNSNKLGGTVKERNKRLCALLKGVNGMNLGKHQDNNVDAFGDAYEYLMGMYASNAGKSGGEYFTPQEVSELLTRLCILDKNEINKIYDPACGSGSLLLKAAKLIDKNKIRNGFYGQEKNPTTKNLATINMFLHGIDYDKFDIALGDTLIEPQHWNDEPFDVIVSNPPYSVKWEGTDNPTLITDERFSPAGVLAPKSKADLAFIMHSLSWLAEGGTAAIVCFPGIFYRGGAEQKIRKYLVDNNYIDAVIQLPENLFFGTSISTCIMVMKKGKKDNTIKFIDASKEFVKITNSNMLTEENINNILKYYKDNKDVQYIMKVASHDNIEKEKYNLSVSTYVEKEDAREKIDIKELNKRIEDIVAREEILRNQINEIIKDLENKEEISKTKEETSNE
jgi:type I restriction enzyme M protein